MTKAELELRVKQLEEENFNLKNGNTTFQELNIELENYKKEIEDLNDEISDLQDEEERNLEKISSLEDELEGYTYKAINERDNFFTLFERYLDFKKLQERVPHLMPKKSYEWDNLMKCYYEFVQGNV